MKPVVWKHARLYLRPGDLAPAKEAPKQNESSNSPNHNNGKRYCMDTAESRFAVPEFDESYRGNLSATTPANAILVLSSTSATTKPPASFCHWNHSDAIALHRFCEDHACFRGSPQLLS